MENRNIIIILVVIIVILVATIGAMLLNPADAKETTSIKITSDKTQYEDGKLSIQLTDLNKTPISKEIVNITITNKKGKVVVDDVVKTDKKGKAKLDLDLKKGKYVVNVTYDGNENYTGSNTTQKLKIKEEAKTTVVKSDESSNARLGSRENPKTSIDYNDGTHDGEPNPNYGDYYYLDGGLYRDDNEYLGGAGTYTFISGNNPYE